MITIHHSPLSRSNRVVWFCEEIGLEYRLEPVEMFSDAMRRPEYLAINPLGKVPAIEDDGFVLWETSAIMQYLDAKYGANRLIPPRDTQAGALAIQWLDYGENRLTVIMGGIARELVDVIEQALGNRQWILGDTFSAADIMLAFGLMIADHLNYVNDATPRVSAYLQRAMARPAFLRSM